MLLSARPMFRWPSQVQPYIKGAQVFVCPSGEKSTFAPNPKLVDPANGGRSRYCGVTTNDGSTGGQGLVSGLSYGRNLIQQGNWTTASGFNALNKSGFVLSSATTTPINEADVEDWQAQSISLIPSPEPRPRLPIPARRATRFAQLARRFARIMRLIARLLKQRTAILKVLTRCMATAMSNGFNLAPPKPAIGPFKKINPARGFDSTPERRCDVQTSAFFRRFRVWAIFHD